MTSLPFSEVKAGTNYPEIIKQFNTHGAISCMFVALVSLIFLSLHVKFISLSFSNKEKSEGKKLLTLEQLSLKARRLVEQSFPCVD